MMSASEDIQQAIPAKGTRMCRVKTPWWSKTTYYRNTLPITRDSYVLLRPLATRCRKPEVCIPRYETGIPVHDAYKVR